MGHVVIVGAGPAGASLAYLLAQRGVDVTLLERQRDFAREFRGEVLMPTGIRALEQMGLGPGLASVPAYRPDRAELFLNRRPVLEAVLDPDFFEGRPPTALSQPALLEMIVAEGEKSGRLHFHRGASVKDVLRDGERVIGVRARTEEGELELRGDLVVGTDGRASIVRRRTPMTANATDLPMDIIWCKVPCPEDYTGMRGYFGRAHLLIAYHTWDGNLQVAWAILKGSFGELRRQGAETWVADMADHVSPDLAEILRTSEELLGRPFLLDTLSDCVTSWTAPGALVLGDAAHTMSPVGGQGLNIALRDAIVAANHLVPVLSAPEPTADAVDAAARATEAERRPEVDEVQRFQAIPPRIILASAWWGEPVRRLFGLLLRTRFGQGLGLRNAGLFLFGSAEVELRV